MAKKFNEFNFWMNENSTGTLENVVLEVDFNIKDRNVQILDVVEVSIVRT